MSYRSSCARQDMLGRPPRCSTGWPIELDPTDARALSRAPQAVAAVSVQRWIRASSDTNHPIDAAAVARVLAVAAGDAVAAEVVGGLRVARSEQRLRIEPTGTS